MILDLGMFLVGILGILILYSVLIRLSSRMGEGMRLPKYYRLYYIAILAIILTIPLGWSIYYANDRSPENNLLALLTAGNILAMAASFKYWWWLKNEVWTSGKGGK
ncbi:MAG: hypothetical protein O8C66_03160 [Candidatus Methanoperedens sp.]|nr:hypothetical protein [Candidatus Methanoperedens sp.]MCZ7369486.1 hypothetical protein [Candidatus Methanoperedens sp.]